MARLHSTPRPIPRSTDRNSRRSWAGSHANRKPQRASSTAAAVISNIFALQVDNVQGSTKVRDRGFCCKWRGADSGNFSTRHFLGGVTRGFFRRVPRDFFDLAILETKGSAHRKPPQFGTGGGPPTEIPTGLTLLPLQPPHARSTAKAPRLARSGVTKPPRLATYGRLTGRSLQLYRMAITRPSTPLSWTLVGYWCVKCHACAIGDCQIALLLARVPRRFHR